MKATVIYRMGVKNHWSSTESADFGIDDMCKYDQDGLNIKSYQEFFVQIIEKLVSLRSQHHDTAGCSVEIRRITIDHFELVSD